jgi:hypothetical protein
MKFTRTRAFFKRLRGKKTANGLSINAHGKTPAGTPVNGINKNGKPVTTNYKIGNYRNFMGNSGGYEREYWNGEKWVTFYNTPKNSERQRSPMRARLPRSPNTRNHVLKTIYRSNGTRNTVGVPTNALNNFNSNYKYNASKNAYVSR